MASISEKGGEEAGTKGRAFKNRAHKTVRSSLVNTFGHKCDWSKRKNLLIWQVFFTGPLCPNAAKQALFYANRINH